MRLCNSRIPEEYLVCYQTSQRNWVIIKMLYRYLRRCLLGWHRSRLGFVTSSIREVSLGPLGNAHHNKPCKHTTNELVAGWCITERVKRLAGSEIELGMKIPTIESRASNIPMTKGIMYVVITVLTDKDLRRICRSQYDHPGSAIGYWSEMCLSHVYIVLEPVGSACLTFDDNLYYELCVLMTEVVQSPGWDHGREEESQNGRDVKIYILEGYIWTSERFRVIRVFFRVPRSYGNTRKK